MQPSSRILKGPYCGVIDDLTLLSHSEKTKPLWFRVEKDDIHFPSELKEKVMAQANYLLPQDVKEHFVGTFHCKLSVRQWEAVFIAAQQLQNEDPLFVIHRTVFSEALNALKLNKGKFLEWKDRIHTKPKLDEYLSEAQTSRNSMQALSAALYYQSGRNSQAIKWLCHVNDYDKEKLNAVDIPEFLEPFDTIDTPLVFSSDHKQILEAIGESTTITKLRLPTSTDYSIELTHKIANFLTKAKAIDELILKASWPKYARCQELDHDSLVPFLDVFKTTRTIKIIDLSNSPIKDKGLIKIIEALHANPQCSVTKLIVQRCGLTEKSVPKIVEFIRTKGINVDISNNPEITGWSIKHIARTFSEVINKKPEEQISTGFRPYRHPSSQAAQPSLERGQLALQKSE